MSKRELLIMNWETKQIYHNNIAFTRLSFILNDKFKDYAIQDFRIYNLEHDGKQDDETLVIELNGHDNPLLDTLQEELDWLREEKDRIERKGGSITLEDRVLINRINKRITTIESQLKPYRI